MFLTCTGGESSSYKCNATVLISWRSSHKSVKKNLSKTRSSKLLNLNQSQIRRVVGGCWTTSWINTSIGHVSNPMCSYGLNKKTGQIVRNWPLYSHVRLSVPENYKIHIMVIPSSDIHQPKVFWRKLIFSQLGVWNKWSYYCVLTVSGQV